MLCYITNVMLCHITSVILCYMTCSEQNMLYNMCHVMLCYVTYVMLCYITCVMLCYITYVMWCYLTYVMLYNMCHVMLHDICYTFQLSRLWNVSCFRPAWHNFQKYVNSDPCKERNPCVKWINGNTFLANSDFWSEKHWERARLWQTSSDFGRLRKTSDFFGNLRKWSSRFQKSQHSQDKNLTPTSQKKFAGIESSKPKK